MLTTAGKTAVANALADPAGNTQVLYVELGTGTNAPALTDVALQTPVYRKAIASWNNVGPIVSLTAYFNLTEVSGTFREIGYFIGGSGTIGTGTLLTRLAINRTKTTSDTYTHEEQITVA